MHGLSFRMAYRTSVLGHFLLQDGLLFCRFKGLFIQEKSKKTQECPENSFPEHGFKWVLFLNHKCDVLISAYIGA